MSKDQNKTMQMGRRGGRRRTRQVDETTQPAPAYLTCSVPPFEYLSDEGLERIEAAADRILAEVGIEFRGHPPSLSRLRDAGADVHGELVRFEPGMCRGIIQKSAPKSFTQLSRNPDRNILIGENAMAFSPLYGAPFARSLDTERRYATIEDFNNFVKLAQMSPCLHHSGGTICEPTDIPVSKRHLDMVYGHIRYSDKPYMGAVTTGWQAEDSVRLTEITFGKDVVDQNCCVLALINPTSPLVFGTEALESLTAYASHGQGSIIDAFIIAGASGPVTPAAMLSQMLAEAMAGMALAQLIRPGAPVIFGVSSMGMNMKTGAPLRFDESWKCVLAAGQLSRRLGVPYRSGGASSASKSSDAQAGYEAALNLSFSVLPGTNLIIHAAGSLELGLCISYEKFLLDCEMLGTVSHMMTGIDYSDDALAMDAFAEAGPGGNFLSTEHTLARYRNAFFEPDIFDTRSFEQWRDDNSLDSEMRANVAVKSMLSSFVAPPIDPGIDEALLDFIACRKTELPDSYA